MAATKTKADLVLKILEELGVVATGQSPELEDSVKVAANIDPVIAELSAREIVDVPDVEAIQSEIFLSLATICAYELRAQFGLVGDALVDLTRKYGEAIDKINVMTRAKPTYEPLRPDYI